MTPLDGALWLVAHGFAVFTADHPGTERCTGIGRGHDPATCVDRGKHPCVPFTKQHTTDPEQARRWFDGPPRNVAVAVGACTGPAGARLVVVDSDRPRAIEDVAERYGRPHTPTMRTHTAKGTHDFYWAPAGVRLGNGLGALRGKFDGDVRAGNAYVIGPGSVHATGAVYELDDPAQPPLPMPAWLLAALQTPAAAPPLRIPYRGGKEAAGRGLLGLVKFVLDSSEGDRNNRLYWAACRAFEHVRNGHVPDRSAADALLQAAVRVGLGESDARATIRSAYRSGASR